MLLVPSAISLEQGKNLGMENKAYIVGVLGKENALDFGLAEKAAFLFFIKIQS